MERISDFPVKLTLLISVKRPERLKKKKSKRDSKEIDHNPEKLNNYCCFQNHTFTEPSFTLPPLSYLFTELKFRPLLPPTSSISLQPFS